LSQSGSAAIYPIKPLFCVFSLSSRDFRVSFDTLVQVLIFCMSLLTILEYPDLRLRKRAEPVVSVDDQLRSLIDDMLETMYAAPGIGLAATQVDVHKRLLVLDVSEENDAPMVFINPEIEVLDPEPMGYEEGCLSVPGYFELVQRPRKIRVRALGRDGNAFEMEAEGLLAVCLQHEVDHLDGKLFVDYLSILKRQRIKNKLVKDKKQKVAS
jgi:peptide deformylase